MAVHVLIIGHVLHWLWAGRTLTPIEPSEAMETIQTGRVNAGFVFFALALLATLFLGRWVCGWGCHLVAYQDLTLWILKKLHLRPKAFRSRGLIFVPLFAALYMFVWPLAHRLWTGVPRPPLTLHLARAGFWDTFPGWGIAVFTLLVCGFLIVYVLGPKGFCTYACPYGAFFALTDKLALGRIRVTDACRASRQCTAACTSNVNVAEEVRLYGRVVNPGCMKCLDCVGTCPNDALYYGFGPMALGKTPSSADKKPVRYDLKPWEELSALAVFAAVFFSYRGLYGNFPFLLSLGVAGIGTYFAVKAVRLLYARDVLIQKVRLKIGGRLRPAGRGYLVLVLALAALTVHSGLWRYHDYAGHRAFSRSPAEVAGWQYDPQYPGRLSEPQQGAVRAGLRHLAFCDRWGLFDALNNNLELAWLRLHSNAPGQAARHIRRAIEMAPENPDLWVSLAKIETSRRDFAAARAAFQRALALEAAARGSAAGVTASGRPNAEKPRRTTRMLGHAAHPISARVWTEWGMFLAAQDDRQGARHALQRAVAFDTGSRPARTALGLLHIRMGEIDAARRCLIEAATLGPKDGSAHDPLTRLAGVDPNHAAAVEDYRTALATHADVPVFHRNMAHALAALKRYDEALSHYREALRLLPEAVDVRAEYGTVLMMSGDVDGAVRAYEAVVEALPANAAAAGRLAFLYVQTGRTTDAVRLYRIVVRRGNEAERRNAESMLRRLGAADPP